MTVAFDDEGSAMRDDHNSSNADNHPIQPQHQPRSRQRGRSLGRFLLLVLLGSAALLFFAPTIVLKTELRNKIVGWAAPDFTGKVAVGSGSGHWFSGLDLYDVAVWDADGEPVARFPRITSTKPLSSWISDQHDLGEIQLQNPEVHLTLGENTSNLERLFEPFLTQTDDALTSPKDSAIPPIRIQVIGGRVLVTDTVGGQNCTIENLELEATTPASAPAPIDVNLSADAQQGAQRGKLSTHFTWIPPTSVSAIDLGDGELQFASQDFPLTALQPLLRRAESDLNLTGQLTANLDGHWKRSPQGPAIEAQGNVSVAQPTVRMPSVLGSDEINLARLTANLDVYSAENQLLIRSVELNSDVATLTVAGQAELADALSVKSVIEKLLDWQSSHQYKVHGQIDVAALAAQIPGLMKLREGTTISQGQINLDLDSRLELGSRILRGTLQTDRIAAMAGGKTITWDAPVSFALASVSNANGVEIKKLNCTSDFLVVDANGTLETGQLTAHGDLHRLVSQLHQFCDLGQLQLTGNMVAEGSWQRAADDRCRLTLQAELNDFAISSESIPPITETRLSLIGNATGQVKAGGVEQLDSCQVQIISGEDQMVAHLTRPVPHPTADTTWPLDCQLAGHSETWLARLQPWGLRLDGWDVRANVSANASGEFHAEKISLTPCTVRLTNLSAKTDGWLIREPEMQLQATCNWQAAGNEINAPAFTLTSSALAVRGQELAFASTETDMRASGQLSFRGELDRLYGWQYSATPPTQLPQGQFDGTAHVSTHNGTISFSTDANLQQFAWMQRSVPAAGTAGTPTPWAPIWDEPKVQVVSKGSYHVATDQLKLEQLTASSSSISVGALGELAHVSSSPSANLTGELRYDLAALAARFQAQLGPNIRLAGQRTAPFSLQGPLVASSLSMAEVAPAAGDILQLSASLPISPVIPPDLTGQTTLGWDAIEAYGVKLGPQEVTTQLQQGTLSFSPITTSLSQGTISMAPRLELNASPMALVMDEGVVAEGINITPEMCATWFQYITPVLAGAAQAEGRMSVHLKGARVPLAHPMLASVAGTVSIEGARLQPGPLAQQLLGTITEVSGVIQRNAPSLSFLAAGENWLEIQPQDVEFQMTDGKVYHRNLELTSGNVTIRTQGWVGTDQSIGMLAEMPILDKWVEDEKFLSGLKGQTVKIPIQGTLSQPQLDRRAISQLSQQLISGTAEKLLQGELQKGLEKGLQKLLGQ